MALKCFSVISTTKHLLKTPIVWLPVQQETICDHAYITNLQEEQAHEHFQLRIVCTLSSSYY
jgi:hypothetical protein